jgi:superfamily II DNA or RNA helicase
VAIGTGNPGTGNPGTGNPGQVDALGESRLTKPMLEGWFGPGIWEWDHRVLKWRSDACHYPEIRKALSSYQTGIVDQVPAIDTSSPSVLSIFAAERHLPTLRAEQQQALEAWSATRRGVVVMPTGTGKTEVALSIISKSSIPTLVVAPVRDLMYQWHRRILRGLGIDAGILGDQKHDVRPVTVTTYASACIHATEIGSRFGLLVFDECHHLTGPIRADAARCSVAPQRLGLTATMGANSQELESLIGPVVYELGLQDVKGRTLADYDVVRLPISLAQTERKRYKELSQQISQYVHERRKEEPDFAWNDLCSEAAQGSEASRIMRLYREKESIEDRAQEKLDVLEDLFRLHLGEPMIIFTGSNAMARMISTRFLIPCLLSHCGKSERLDYLEGLRDGVYPALVANQVLDEGVDLPEVKVAVVLGGKSSTRQSKQRLGRILRKRGDARAVLYEVVATETKEVQRSRNRRRNDAYQGTRHRKVRRRPDPS